MRGNTRIFLLSAILFFEITLLATILVIYLNSMQTQTQLSPGSDNQLEQTLFSPSSLTQERYFGDMPVTYYIDESCPTYEKNQIGISLDKIASATYEVVSFDEEIDAANANIIFSCQLIPNCYSLTVDTHNGVTTRTETICEHTAGEATITKIEKNEIQQAEIVIYGLENKDEENFPSYAIDCGDTRIEDHEILHAFGYSHSEDKKSVMYPAEEYRPFAIFERNKCDSQLSLAETDQDIIFDLIQTYDAGKGSISGRFIEEIAGSKLSPLGMISLILIIMLSAILVIEKMRRNYQ